MENKTAKQKKKKTTRFAGVVSTFILCYLLWIGLTWSLDPKELIVGAVISIIVASLTAPLFIHEDAFYLFNPIRLIKFFYYAFVVLFGEIIKANWDMAKRVLKADPPTNPGIIRIKADVDSEYGLAFLCNAITLTPGTISVEAAEREGQEYIYVHWIDVTTLDRDEAGDIIKARLEKWIRRV